MLLVSFQILQGSQIPSTITEALSNYDSSDTFVDNDESDEVSTHVHKTVIVVSITK